MLETISPEQTSSAIPSALGSGYRIAFIGSAGIPNRYGGFESFLEQCAPELAALGADVWVSCDARLYPDGTAEFEGVKRAYLRVPANGKWSILHDLLAFWYALPHADNIVILGVSGGIWLPLMRLVAGLRRKRLIINVDGIEWRRAKHRPVLRWMLRAFDWLAQMGAHTVVIDNPALMPFIPNYVQGKTVCIPYSGDHTTRHTPPACTEGGAYALTICRIEPENNLEMLIEAFLASPLQRYVIVGNWEHSAYSRALYQRYQHTPRLELRLPVYDPLQVAALRAQCSHYLHGHSVGGTNPSLVEILFYECHLYCFDVEFNRQTARETAHYFKDARALTTLLSQPPNGPTPSRATLRLTYTANDIARRYLALMRKSA